MSMNSQIRLIEETWQDPITSTFTSPLLKIAKRDIDYLLDKVKQYEKELEVREMDRLEEMTQSHFRGHAIEKLDGEWVYSDTKESTVKTYEKRPCGHCDKMPTQEGHDACLGTLIGVMNACCGHGQTNEAYAQLLDGHGIHGEDAITVMAILKKHS